MHRRKDNYSDGPKYSRHNIRNHSFQQSNLSSNSNLASSSDRLSHDKSKYQSIRVVQKNMIHVVGFPQNLKSQNIASEEYFGMYGNVQKYSMTPIITRCKGKSKIYSYNAFITYTDEIESSLAIVALDGKTIGERLLKVSFGTTKYCSFFIKGSDCPNIRECLFLHEHQEDNELMIDEENMKAVYKEQLRVAVKVVKENLEKVLSRKKLVDMRGRKIRSDFPTIEETLNCLVAMKVIDKSMIEDKEEGKKNSSYDNKQPSLTIPISTSNNNLSPNIPNSNNHRKSVSNISISTEFSHSKQLKNKYNFKRQSSASLQKQRNKSRGKSAGRWGSKGKNPTENDKNEINRLINKLIVEKIMAKKDNHQRSRFAPLQPPKDRKCSEKIKYLLCKELLFESETNP